MLPLRAQAALASVLLAHPAIGDELLSPPPLPPSVEDVAATPDARQTEPAWIVPAPRPEASPVPPPPRRPRKRRILISDFRTGESVPADLGRTLAAVAVREASQLEGWEVITKGDLIARLGAEHGRQMLGCADDGSCLAELAGALDAEQSLGGTIAAAGDGVLLTLTLVDMRQVTTIRSRTETLRTLKADDLVDVARRMSYEVISGKPFDLTGTLDIEVAERDTNVFVDGDEVGAGPYRETRRVKPGEHRVAVLRGEKVLFLTDVRVEAAGRTTVRPNLATPSADVLETLLKKPAWGGPYYYGQPFVGLWNVRMAGANASCPDFDNRCNGGGALGIRLGVAVIKSLAFEAWAETGGRTGSLATGWYGRMDSATVVGAAAVLRLPWAFGLRTGGGVRHATFQSWSWSGSSAPSGGAPTGGGSDTGWVGSVDVLFAPRWGPVRFELSVAAIGFGSGLPSKFLPAGASAPTAFAYQPIQLGIGLILPLEPSRERMKYTSPPPPPAPPAPPDDTYRPPGM